MRLRDILQVKGHNVISTRPDATLREAIDKLIENNCGSLVVMEGERMIGIITERDILKAAANTDQPLGSRFVRDHMTSDVLIGTPDDKVTSVMGLMTQERIRHLPVCEQERLVGVISIGDVVKAQHDHLSVENHYLKNYIQS